MKSLCLRIILLAGLAAALGACATASKPGAMVAELTAQNIIAENSVLREAVAIGAVTGGKETNPLWTSQVSSTDFAEALRQSFAAHAMLANADERYQLDAEMVKLKQPFAGFNLTVTSTVKYTLTEISSSSIVYEETITHAHTAKAGEAFVAAQRLRLANEGSIKGNIAALIDALVERFGAIAAPTSMIEDAIDIEMSS